MKLSEMNSRQRKVTINVFNACDWLIGGLENTMNDYSQDSEEYKRAEALLNDHEALVAELYSMATTSVYDEGATWFGCDVESYLKDVRFCGKDFIMERCHKRLIKEGY